MTFRECFTKLMKERGQSDKAITLALVQAETQQPLDDHQLTEDEEKGLTELANILALIPPMLDLAEKKVRQE